MLLQEVRLFYNTTPMKRETHVVRRKKESTRLGSGSCTTLLQLSSFATVGAWFTFVSVMHAPDFGDKRKNFALISYS